MDLIPSLTFIEPYWLSKYTGIEIRALDGAFWSIFVEIKFYIISAILFFYLFKDRNLNGLVVLYISFILILFYNRLEGDKPQIAVSRIKTDKHWYSQLGLVYFGNTSLSLFSPAKIMCIYIWQ